MGYRHDVITDSVQDAIRHAGGLMFDRSRAGWQVVVFTDDDAHPRALAILGIRTRAPHGEERKHPREPDFRTVVAPLGGAGPDLEPAADNQLLLWGHPDAGDSAGDRQLDRQLVGHTLSTAARTFKAHALHCIGVDAAVEQCEHFWTDDTTDARLFVGSLPVDNRRSRPRVPASSAARSPTVVGGWVRG